MGQANDFLEPARGAKRRLLVVGSRLSCYLLTGLVVDVTRFLGANSVNDIFANVSCLVSDAFEKFGDKNQLHVRGNQVHMVDHQLRERFGISL